MNLSKQLSNPKVSQLVSAKWITSLGNFSIFATVTFHQSGLNDKCTYTRFRHEEYEATCKEIVRRTRKRLKAQFPEYADRVFWVTVLENGGWQKRFHAHFLYEMHASIDPVSFDELFRYVCSRLDKVDERIDVRLIEDIVGNGNSATTHYCLKEGSDALLLSACHLNPKLMGHH